jgi:hypothetical protein
VQQGHSRDYFDHDAELNISAHCGPMAGPDCARNDVLERANKVTGFGLGSTNTGE